MGFVGSQSPIRATISGPARQLLDQLDEPGRLAHFVHEVNSLIGTRWVDAPDIRHVRHHHNR
jgi:hypothetical protein